MLAPLSWLKKYVEIDKDAQTLTNMLTMTGSEVEGYENLAKGLDHVVVGKITKIDKHPDADRLQVCRVNVGEEKDIIIVTGATNVYEGALVTLAREGADLPNGTKITKGKLRGVVSYGMMCSGEELCIDDSVYPGASVNGIMLINEDVKPGTSIASVLGMDDIVFDIKTYANRPDCLSVVGTAREVAATLNVPLTMPETTYKEDTKQTQDIVSVEVSSPDLCPRYMGKIVYDIKIEPSPKWMQKSLAAAGVRPINNIVDITNYVMLELGQPMHAFDFKYVKEQKIVVRNAKNGESIMTLDGKERKLTEEMLVIADAEKPIALAGIMGGEHSGIYEDTNTVLFESAIFNHANIRMTARALGMRTESSSRYEKGLEAANAELALNRAMHLIEKLGAGKIAQGCADVLSADISPRTLTVSIKRVNELLGLDLPGNTMDGLLRRLQIESHAEGDSLICEIPAFRQDLQNTADIAEEILRIYGFDKIPSKLPEMHIESKGRTARQRTNLAIRNYMSSHGLYEAVHYSFMSPAALDMLLLPEKDELRNAVKIINPLGEDYSLMRTTLMPAMIKTIAANLNHRIDDVKLFELSKTFHESNDDLPLEVNRLSIGVCSDDETFFTVKGRVESMLKPLGLKNYEFKRGGGAFLHPGRKAIMLVDEIQVGFIGELHPDVADAAGIKKRTYLAEINLDALLEIQRSELVVAELPKYPSVSRDLAVVVDKDQPVGQMLSVIKASCGNLLESIEIFDIYEGAQVEKDKKSVAFSLIFRASDRTLVDEDVNKKFVRILNALDKNFNAKLRE
ncbi:MAG: phenylalanine--tRNA ligase subunit beta [Clostridia bacterium]|nr:phenylalanine--tRNA ligase subunit beta [Clostridia bacterium]